MTERKQNRTISVDPFWLLVDASGGITQLVYYEDEAAEVARRVEGKMNWAVISFPDSTHTPERQNGT